MEILSAKWVVPMVGEPIMAGAVAIEGDEIVDVGFEMDLIDRYPHAEVKDYTDHVIMPGLINCHTHLDMSNYQNFENDPVRKIGGGAVNYIDWLIGCLTYKMNIDGGQVRESVAWGIDQCLQSGTTCVADMGNYEGIFSLLEQKGLRAVVFPEVISCDSSVSKDMFESAMAIVEKYHESSESELVSVGMGPYSSFMLSRNILRILSQYCRSSQLPLMMHVSNSFSEMEFFNDSTGDVAEKLFPVVGWDDLPPSHHKTPIQHLLNLGFFDCRPILVGCTQATPSDLAIIAQTGSKIVITPRSGLFLQQGQPDLQAIFDNHIITALGTDGMPSVDSLSLWDEMRALLQNYQQMNLTGHQILSMATKHAAIVLGLDSEIGTLEPGKRADLIVVEASGVSENGDFLLDLISQVKDYHVREVRVGGRVVKTVNG